VNAMALLTRHEVELILRTWKSKSQIRRPVSIGTEDLLKIGGNMMQ
jgi:hypothetical protein